MESVLRARKSNTETVYLSKIMREKDASTGQPLDDNQLAEEAMGLMCVRSLSFTVSHSH